MVNREKPYDLRAYARQILAIGLLIVFLHGFISGAQVGHPWKWSVGIIAGVFLSIALWNWAVALYIRRAPSELSFPADVSDHPKRG